ncbi:hypothetical protein MLD38_024778 [Melastoma candidum]|uniref:Uncharacterized protein n=1 Tax=Melastoma candidum TaxID=119954 RepID=A0ACB9NUB5_9MYRT|nr:hypothetical protein MLD38_024778 [Melastoma candidum]
MDRSVPAAIDKPTKRRRRGRSRRIFDSLLCSTEIMLISLFLLSYHSSGVPASVEIVGEVLRRILCLSSKPLPVFFISNVIILAVAVLSGVGEGKNGRTRGVADDIYEEYVARCKATSAGRRDQDEKRIVLYSASGASTDRGKGSWSAAVGSDGRVKNKGPPRRKGRLALPGVVGEDVSRTLVVVVSDGGAEDVSPPEGKKAEKSSDVASPHGKRMLTLPGDVREHALESPATKEHASSSTACKHVMPKSPSDSSINRETHPSSISILVSDGGNKKGPNSDSVASPRGRGRSVAATRNGAAKTVEDMSNEEFNQRVEKYIAKTRRFLREEGALEVGSADIEHLQSFQNRRSKSLHNPYNISTFA